MCGLFEIFKNLFLLFLVVHSNSHATPTETPPISAARTTPSHKILSRKRRHSSRSHTPNAKTSTSDSLSEKIMNEEELSENVDGATNIVGGAMDNVGGVSSEDNYTIEKPGDQAKPCRTEPHPTEPHPNEPRPTEPRPTVCETPALPEGFVLGEGSRSDDDRCDNLNDSRDYIIPTITAFEENESEEPIEFCLKSKCLEYYRESWMLLFRAPFSLPVQATPGAAPPPAHFSVCDSETVVKGRRERVRTVHNT